VERHFDPNFKQQEHYVQNTVGVLPTLPRTRKKGDEDGAALYDYDDQY